MDYILIGADTLLLGKIRGNCGEVWKIMKNYFHFVEKSSKDFS